MSYEDAYAIVPWRDVLYHLPPQFCTLTNIIYLVAKLNWCVVTSISKRFFEIRLNIILHGRQCSPLRQNFMECSINSPALSLLMKHLVIGQRLKTPNFSAFHWSPRGSLDSIGQHFVATRVVHLPKVPKQV